MDIAKLLSELGLGEAENIVYLEALKNEYFTAREMSDATGIKRPAVYYTLASLQRKGLVFITGKGKVEKFKAEHPNQLLAMIDRQKHRLNSIEEKITKALPFFPEKDQMPTGLPNITYHRGMEGMKNLIEKVYQCREKILYTIMPSFRNIEPRLDENYASYYLEERAKRGITTKSIWQDYPSEKEFCNHKKYLREVRIAPKSAIGSLNSMIDIFDHYVVISTDQPELFGLAIASYDYSQTMKAMFDAIWRVSKPLKEIK